MSEQVSTRGRLRDQAREPAREGLRPGEVLGRDGEVLSRRRKDDGTNIFLVPPELIPDGWEYQWMAVSIKGDSDLVSDKVLMWQENGWRPVPSERHPGRYMPAGSTSKTIIRGGQMLMERPKALCDEARKEHLAKSIQQMRDRDEALTGGKSNFKNQMKGGFEMSNKFRPKATMEGMQAPENTYELDPGE